MARPNDEAIGRLGSFSTVVKVAHPTGVGTAYADLDGISPTGFATKIPNVFRQVAGSNLGNTAVLQSIAITDRAKQAAAMHILLFNAMPVITSADNGALDISDVEMAAKFIGRVEVAATDYINLNVNSSGTVKNIGLVCKADGQDLWAVLQSGGSPTYTTDADLVISYGFLQD